MVPNVYHFSDDEGPMFNNYELEDDLQALEELVEMGYIEKDSLAYGVSKQYFFEGLESLSNYQKFIFEREVAPVIFRKCLRCSILIELRILTHAYRENLMLCDNHRYQYLKG